MIQLVLVFGVLLSSLVASALDQGAGCVDGGSWCETVQTPVENAPLPVPRPDDLGLPANAPLPPPRPADLGGSGNRNNGNGSGGSGSGSSSCQSQYDSLKTKCENEIESTSYTCDEKNDSGVNSVSGAASQLALQMGQQTSSNVQAACSGMADISQAANAALAAYRLNCSNSLSECRRACTELVNYAKSNESCLGGTGPKTTAEEKVRTCNNYVAKVNEANQAIKNYGQTGANASQCKNQTTGTTTDPSATPEICKTTPNYPGCPGAAPTDCSNPEFAATNKVCVCVSNPMDPMCSQQQKAGGDMVGTNNIDSSSRLAGNSDSPGDIPDLPSIQHGQLPTGGGEGLDGQQGSGVHFDSAGGGSGRGANSASLGRGSDSESPTAVNSGFYGGGTGTNAAVYGGDGGGSSGGGRGSTYASTPTNPQGPNLRDFLPGGKFDPSLRRGIAGQEPGLEGITGPSSDNWQKIQNRYRVISPTLLVP